MVKLVVYAPRSHADAVRSAIGEAGGGHLGPYTFCSFSVRGTGRFRPGPGASPHIGTVGALESVDEERIEVTCDDRIVRDVIAAIRRVHPYEEIPIDLYALISMH